jgi:hypothetical protein
MVSSQGKGQRIALLPWVLTAPPSPEWKVFQEALVILLASKYLRRLSSGALYRPQAGAQGRVLGRAARSSPCSRDQRPVSDPPQESHLCGFVRCIHQNGCFLLTYAAIMEAKNHPRLCFRACCVHPFLLAVYFDVI